MISAVRPVVFRADELCGEPVRREAVQSLELLVMGIKSSADRVSFVAERIRLLFLETAINR
jgi:hypothetical protein